MSCAYLTLVLVFCTFYLWSAYSLIPIMSIWFLCKAKFIVGADPKLEGKCHHFFFSPSKSEVSRSALWVGESFAIFRNVLVKTSNSVVQQNLNSYWKFQLALLYCCSSKMMSLCGHFLINSCQFGGETPFSLKLLPAPWSTSHTITIRCLKETRRMPHVQQAWILKGISRWVNSVNGQSKALCKQCIFCSLC